MPRWLLWTPIAAFTVATAFFGLRTGWQVTALSESDVINVAVQNYLDGGQGRVASDCHATPSDQSGIWLTVTCSPADGPQEIYHATRFGNVRLGRADKVRPEA